MERRIKILLMLEATIGGAYRHVLQLALLLQKEEFDVTVLFSAVRNQGCHADMPVLEQAGVQCLFIPMARNISVADDIKAFVAIRQLLRNQCYDIIHTHSSKAGLLGRIAAYLQGNIRIIHTPHSYFFQEKAGIAKWLMKIPERLLAYMTDSMVTVSESEKALTKKERIIDHDKIVMIKNAVLPGTTADERTKASLQKQYNIPEGKKIITGVGRLTRQKNWGTFVRMAAEMIQRRSDVHFIIAGDGEDWQQLTSQIRRLGLHQHISMTGYCKRMDEIYSLTDVLLHTSLWEGMPYALLEAMSYCIPVVATAVTGNIDIIFPDRNGYLFSPGQYRNGILQLDALLNDEVQRKAIGRAGYDYVVAYHSADMFVRQHEQLYRSRLHL